MQQSQKICGKFLGIVIILLIDSFYRYKVFLNDKKRELVEEYNFRMKNFYDKRNNTIKISFIYLEDGQIIRAIVNVYTIFHFKADLYISV